MPKRSPRNEAQPTPSPDRIGNLTRAQFEAALRAAIDFVALQPEAPPSRSIYQMKPVALMLRGRNQD